MDNLIIVGAGAYGREAFTIAKNSIGYLSDFTIKGYLSNEILPWPEGQQYPPIIGTVEAYEIAENDVFVIAISDCNIKQKCAELLTEKGARFINLIHNGCILGDHVSLGKGVFLGYDVIISNDSVVGDHVSINSRTVIGHDFSVGEYSSIGASVFIGGHVCVGQKCTIHSSSQIMRTLKIGDKASVGIGSTVLTNVPAERTVFGSPAKVVF